MPPRPRSLATVALVVLLAAAGCVGVLTGEEALAFEAQPATVSAAAQADSGYEEVRRTSQPTTREFTVAGQTREVEVTNRQVEYARSVTVESLGSGDLARFVVVATPAVEVLGRTFNPVGDLSNRQLAEQLQDDYEGLGELRPAGERSVPVLGADATVSTYTADATVGDSGAAVELTVHVTRVRHDADFVVVVAVHPTLLDGEADRVDRLLGGLQHG